MLQKHKKNQWLKVVAGMPKEYWYSSRHFFPVVFSPTHWYSVVAITVSLIIINVITAWL